MKFAGPVSGRPGIPACSTAGFDIFQSRSTHWKLIPDTRSNSHSLEMAQPNLERTHWMFRENTYQNYFIKLVIHKRYFLYSNVHIWVKFTKAGIYCV